ncbi:MAG: response regulator transcription factor [Akkermansiaceae bacterium]|nr:response regulator transcription factor [Akkermansiaceae bacterium]
MKEKITIMLVEDNPAYRRVIQRALKDDPYIEEMVYFGTAEIALRGLEATPKIVPDLILLDLSLPGMTGLDAIPKFLHSLPDAKIIILTQSDSEVDVIKAISSGAVGYLLKSSTRQQIKDAIWTVMDGGASLDSAVSIHVLEALKERSPQIELDRNLSEREMATLRLLAEGLSRKEIADRLGIGVTTVVTHLNRIYEKLDVPNAPAAISKAYQSGLL